MQSLIVSILFLFGFFLGAYAHERDMVNNVHRDGATHGWVENLKCSESEDK